MEQSELLNSQEPPSLPPVDVEAELAAELDALSDKPQAEPKPATESVSLPPVKDLVNRAVFVSIRLRKPGATRKIDSNRITFDASKDDDGVDKDMISVSKRLIDCKEFKAIGRLDAKMKRFIAFRCTPSLVRDGIFLLAIGLVNELDREILGFEERRIQAIKEYGEVYDKRVKEALDRLGPEGDPNDYPPWEVVEKQYAFEMQYLSLQAPTVLGDVNKAIFEREEARVAKQFASAFEVQQNGMRKLLQRLVSALSDALAVEPGGAKKRFHKSTVDNLAEFLRIFQYQNITEDKQLADLVAKSKQLLEGVDVKELRSDDAIRKEVEEGFIQIKKTLAELVVEEPLRPIVFDD